MRTATGWIALLAAAGPVVGGCGDDSTVSDDGGLTDVPVDSAPEADAAPEADVAVEADTDVPAEAEAETVDDGHGDGAVPAPTYTPLVVEDFEEGTDEQDAGWPATTGGPMAYDTERFRSGGTSIRVSFRHGANGYGGYRDLPRPVAPGETVWYRVRLFLPATLSLSYGDTSGDGFGWNKFLVMARPGHGSPRMYVQPRSPFKVDHGDPEFYGTGLYVNHDGLGDAYCRLMEETYTFPRDRWFALQMAWHVATDGSAWIRVWSDDEFLGECPGAGAVPDGYVVQSWGIGDYWNGGAWIQGDSTGDFWLDDVVLTAETPNTVDVGGRPFVHPDHF